jgi:ferredoxin
MLWKSAPQVQYSCGTNPFTRVVRDLHFSHGGLDLKATVDEDLCSGCGPCEDICPEVFAIVDGISKVKLSPVPPGLHAKCREAAENCPIEAISITD